MSDRLEIEILEDGTISVHTGRISAMHHTSAEEFLDLVEKLAGGVRETTQLDRKSPRLTHTHRATIKRR